MTLGADRPESSNGLPLLGYAPALEPRNLGDPAFKETHHLKYAYVAGAMANGITSIEMVNSGRAFIGVIPGSDVTELGLADPDEPSLPAMHHLWFLWFLCWLVGGYVRLALGFTAVAMVSANWR